MRSAVKTSNPSRSRLIKAATKLFANQGFEGASLKEIAEAADSNIALVSYHFGGKLELYQSCVEQFGLDGVERVQRILTKAENKEELRVRISLFVEEMMEFNMSQPDIARLVYREFEMNSDRLEHIFRKTFIKVFETLVEFLQDARKEKFIKRSIDPVMAASIWFSVVSHMTRMNLAFERYFGMSLNDPTQREKFTAMAVEMLVNGMVEK